MTLPIFAQSISICLSNILGSVGVNETTVTKRREMYNQAELIKEIGHNLMAKYCGQLVFKNYMTCHFGSKMEGSTTLGMKSDIDLVHFSPFMYEIVQSNCEKKSSVFTLMMDNSAPTGHCKLNVISGPLYEGLSYYHHKHNQFIPNSHIDKYCRSMTDMHGFAALTKNGPSSSYNNVDYIKGILVPPHLSMTNEILNRFRTYQWPTKQLIVKVKEENGLVVPIGHPKSENANVEWRVSYSFAERLLIFDFNITQLRSLVILKMLKKTFFQPIAGDQFTSYHCKTILFYTIARTSPYLWREDRLFDCILNCLSTLQHFLFSRYCPHFFDPSVNLFIGKLTPLLCRSLGNILYKLMNDHLLSLLQIQIDDIEQRMLNVSITTSCFRSRKSIEERIIAEIVFDRNNYLIEHSRFPYICMFQKTLKKQIYTGFRLINQLLHIIGNSNEKEQFVARLMLPHFIAKHSSLLAAYRIKKKQPLSDELIDLFKIGFQTDATSTRLKLASVLCCNNEYEKSLKVLNEICKIYGTSPMLIPTCFSYILPYSSVWEECYKFSSDSLSDVCCRNSYSSCVDFKRKDIWCCPIGLRRSIYTYFTDGSPQFENNRSMYEQFGIELDSQIMFHYLNYLTYSGLSCKKHKMYALKQLMQTVVGNSKTLSKYFFEIANRKDLGIVNMFWRCMRKDYEFNVKCDNALPKLLNNLRDDPWGGIRQCLMYAFGQMSPIQHPEIALILIGYSLELENKIDFASAFYWMSFILDPNCVANQHLLRVRPRRDIDEYLKGYCIGIYSPQLEMDLIPEIVEAFVNIMKANIYLGLLQEDDFQESSYDARIYVCLLNAHVRKFDQNKRKPLEVFPRDRQIVQAKRSRLFL